MTEVKHHTRNIGVAPRKLRLVVDKVRHMSPEKAIALMPHINKRGALHVEKALKAAVEAAKDLNLNEDTLIIQRIWADEGTAMKRIISRSRGRATGIMKKSSHITIVLKGEDAAAAAPKGATKKRIKATEADLVAATTESEEK
jgi:large subunit ribosomal protein L22